MANQVETFLSSIGARIKAFFDRAEPIARAVVSAAVTAQPIVDVALSLSGNAPAAALYNTVSNAAQSAEIAAAAAGAQTGTGAQKAAAVLANSTVQNAFTAFEQAVGVAPHSTEQQQQYISAVVATLNNLNGAPAVVPAA